MIQAKDISDTLTKEKILLILRQEKEFFQKNFGVIEIGIFGSYAKESHHSESDVDIAVKFIKPSFDYYVNLHNYLEMKLHHKIDLFRLKNNKTKFQKKIEEQIIHA